MRQRNGFVGLFKEGVAEGLAKEGGALGEVDGYLEGLAVWAWVLMLSWEDHVREFGRDMKRAVTGLRTSLNWIRAPWKLEPKKLLAHQRRPYY